MQDQILQEIKDRLNIADVLSGYIALKKAGTNFKAVCPFHSEKTPSLMISPQKQIWHCFGCGEGGDIFGFVMRYENLEFKDALKFLADKAGVKLPEYHPKDKKEIDAEQLLYKINDFAARFYHQILLKDKSASDALQYLKKRGLNLETIKQWQIGYAPNDFHALEKALLAKKVGLNDLLKAGVSSKNERGQIYDRFRDRVTFPIYNYMGEAVGFSARILHDDGKSAKYINSPETVIYNKSRVLFGLSLAKTAIRKADEAVIVEGQMDCITAHQAGFANVVASSGTALTLEQLALLSRLTKNLKFCFDADAAGLAASRRAGELALKQGFRIKVIQLKSVKDPDELIKKSPGLWEKAASEAVWFIDFYIELARKQAPEDKIEQLHFLSDQVVPLISFIQDPLEQDHYIRKITELFEVTERTIREQVKPAKQNFQNAAVSAKIIQNFGLEKIVLGGLLKFPEFQDGAVKALDAEDFENAEIKELVKPLLSGKSISEQSVAESTVAKEAIFMVESQLDELGGNIELLHKELQKSFAQLKISGIKRQQQKLNAEIKRVESQGDKITLNELNRKFAQLASLRIQFEKST